MTLSGEDIEAIASRVAERLNEARRRQSVDGLNEGLVDAATVARLLGVSRATVYANADQLGAIRLGKGKRARLRFDPTTLIAAKRSGPDAGRPAQIARKRRPSTRPEDPAARLLPIRGAAQGVKRRRLAAQSRS